MKAKIIPLLNQWRTLCVCYKTYKASMVTKA